MKLKLPSIFALSLFFFLMAISLDSHAAKYNHKNSVG